MRLTLSLFGCRVLFATGPDTEDASSEPPAVVSNVAGDFTAAPTAEPYTDHTGFGFTRAAVPDEDDEDDE